MIFRLIVLLALGFANVLMRGKSSTASGVETETQAITEASSPSDPEWSGIQPAGLRDKGANHGRANLHQDLHSDFPCIASPH